jgi:GT2 family glycosyltransferase
VSVLICTKDRRAVVTRALASLRADGVDRAGVEIVVVEETARPEPIPGVRYVPLPPEGRGFAHVRNAAVETARGSLLVFVDDDCEVERGWFDALLAPLLADPTVGGTAGAVMVRCCNAIGHAESILGFPGGGLRYHDAAGGRVVPTAHLSTCNCAYRRAAIEAAGGFSPRAVLGGEDSLLAEQVTAQWPCRYVPDAIVYHAPRQRLGAIFRWFVRRGRAEILVLPAKARPAAVARDLVRGSMLLRALAVAVAVVWLPWPAWLTVPALLGAYYAVLLRRFAFARRYPTHRAGWWLTPLVKVVADVGAEVGRVRELAAAVGRRREPGRG